VHSLTNVITMAHDIHDYFDRMQLYFEATNLPNRYEMKTIKSNKPHPNKGQFVIFSTNDPQHLPVPAHELLALHATCCKVANLSGASEHIEKMYRDAEDIGVMSQDGTSGDVLNYALLSALSNTVSVQG